MTATQKRARQQRARRAREIKTRRARQARRNTVRRRWRVGAVLAVIVIVVVVLVALIIGGGGSHPNAAPITTTTPSTTIPSTGPSSTAAPSATTATPASSAHHGVITAAAAAAEFPGGSLIDRPAPAHSPACAARPATSAATTTIPASGHRVSIVPAPRGLGFPTLNGRSPRYTVFTAAPPFCINAAKTYTATVHTDVGTFTITLLPKVAPVAVNNFVFLAGYHYYDGTVFNRAVTGFIDQGGDPTATGTGIPGYTFADELPKDSSAYIGGAVGMANSSGVAGAANGGANTNGSQFFIDATNVATHVKVHYPVFGLVTAGQSVLSTINADGSANGTPTKYHRILSVSLSES